MKYNINTAQSALERVDDNMYFAVLGCIAADMGDADSERISAKLGIDRSAVESAVAFWKGAGILTQSKPEAGENPHILPSAKGERGIPSYTASDLAKHIDENKEISSLLHYCSKRTERILSPAETGDIVYLVDSVGLTPTMVMTLVNYFTERGKRGIRYIAKSAISIYDEGVTDDALLNEYIRKKNEYAGGETFFRNLIGAGGRSLIKKEKAFIERWIVGGKTDRGLIEEAYERTVAKTSKASVDYMSKILENWESSGYKTADDVKNAEASGKTAPDNATDIKRKRTVLDDFDEAAAALSSDNGKSAGEEKPSVNIDMTSFFDD